MSVSIVMDDVEEVTGMDPAGGVLVPTVTVHPLLTAGDVARVLNVGERTVWRMTSRADGGAGPFPRPVRIGRHVVRWRWRDVEKYLHELSQK